MTFQVTSHQHTFAFRPEPTTVWRLEDTNSGCMAEIAPELGCNCYQWRVTRGGKPTDLLYADPQVFPEGRPTRSGIPILFPFPNRLRGGLLPWEGKTHQLPLTDSNGKNAIHGFACRHPWRVSANGASAQSAWLAAEFQASRDAPETRTQWLADYRLTVTFRLSADRLQLEAAVENVDRTALPFGLGYHPYFRLHAADDLVRAPAGLLWELEENLPTGKRLPVDAPRNLSSARPASQLQLDDVFTALPCDPSAMKNGLCFRGQVGQVQLWTSQEFRELVAFTPPHRQAVCLEPYTCTTDAANLQARGIDAGWLTLAPGQSWNSVFAMAVSEE
jgi:aldose 1-epimerase